MADESPESLDDDANIIENNNGDEDPADGGAESRISKLKKSVAANPYDYDSHTALIRTLRELQVRSDDDLRSAREAMFEVFPLTPKLWLEWIEDEKDLSSVDYIRKLFESAVGDYLSIELWIEYCQWSMGLGDFAGSRQLFERAVAACGLHVRQGSILWDVYREFEMSVAAFLDRSEGSTENEKTEQRERIHKLFKRQLSVPLMGIESTWDEYMEFLEKYYEEDEDPDEEVVSVYSSALNQLTHLIPWEDKLDSAENQKSRVYSEYLEQERKEKNKNPARIKLLFERAITENCLDEHLWIEYLSWLDRYLRQHDVILPIYERAVRNCYWCPTIWQRYILAVERAGKDWSEIDSVCSRATSCGFTDASDGVLFWLNYIYSIRRRQTGIAKQTGSPVNFEPVAEAFVTGKDFLLEAFGDQLWDPDCYYRKSWARFEASRRNNMDFARKIWREEIMPQGNGPLAAFWMEYFELERQFGAENRMQNCRKILGMAVNSVTDFPDAVCHTFLQFEREEGSLADLDAAMQRVETRMGHFAAQKKAKREKWDTQRQLKRKYPQNLSTTKPSSDASLPKKEAVQRKRKAEEDAPSEPAEKLQRDAEGFRIPSVAPIPKKKPDAEQTSATAEIPVKKVVDTSKYDRTVFVANLKFDVEEERLKSIFSPLGEIDEVRIVRKTGNRSKGYGFVEFKKSDSVVKALEMDRTPVDGRPMYISKAEDKKEHPTQFRYNVGLEKNKLFVKDLSKEVTEQQLSKLFSPHGNLKQVRLAVTREGKSKGIAYIDYDDEDSAARALLKMDGLFLHGQQMKVAISNPPPKPEKGPGAFGQSYVGGQRIPHSSKVQLTPRALRAPPVRGAAGTERKGHLLADSQSGSEESSISETAEKAKMTNDQFRSMFLKK